MKKQTIISGIFCLLVISFTACKKSISEQSADPNPPSKKIGFEFNEQELIDQNYVKVFEDNFSSIDESKWEIWNGGAYNNELQLYRNQNMSIEDGNLVIKSKRENVRGKILPEDSGTKNFSFTSGRIDSKFTFSASNATPKVRFAASIKLPSGTGMWPAFWTNGDQWPTKGEIDILEALGDPFSYQTDYFYGTTPGEILNNDLLTMKQIDVQTNLSTQFHVYEVIWEKNKLTYLLDGTVVDTKTSTGPGGEYIPAFFGKDHHVTLNLAVGGDMFGDDLDPKTIQPGTMYVNWVKIYTSAL
jgi:beta-glucanase (GH16 family)